MATQAERTAAMRERLVAAARARFVEHGFAATSIADVLADAEVSKGALYHHFDTKEALFEAVFETVEAEVMARVLEGAELGDDPVATLRQGSTGWLEVVTEPELAKISLIEAPVALGWARWRELDEAYGFGLVKGLMTQAAADGRLAVADPDVAAHALLALLGELALLVVRADDPDAVKASALDAVDRHITALTTG